jgi:hypothetical protein
MASPTYLAVRRVVLRPVSAVRWGGVTLLVVVAVVACLLCGGLGEAAGVSTEASGVHSFPHDDLATLSDEHALGGHTTRGATVSELVAKTPHPNARSLRPLPPGTPCDAHGYQGKTMFSSRMKRSLDFQLCKRIKGEEYCEQCKCTWSYYWEAAQLCFRLDPEFKARVFAEKQQWDDDSLLYCNRQAMEYSLDEKSPEFCGALGITVKPTLASAVAVALASLLTVWQLHE